MKRLILIFGDLATGKSTLAAKISAESGTALVRKDELKEILADTVGFANRAENLRLSAAAFALMKYTLSSLARSGSDLILESNFREGELGELISLAQDLGYGVLPICLFADVEILYERFIKRMTAGRHRVHLTQDLTDRAGFIQYVEGQRHGSLPSECLRICANDFSYQTDEELRDTVKAFLQN